MGNRLTQIATRTGDKGTTGLADNTRLAKSDDRIALMGDIDELNSQIGTLLCESLPAQVRDVVQEMQHQLFNFSSCIALPGCDAMAEAAVLGLDEALARFNASLPRLKEFILPGGTRAAAQAHVCRTVARRAERSLVRLQAQHQQPAVLLQYLNRLSDLLFVLARVLNRAGGQDDIYWQSRRLQQELQQESTRQDETPGPGVSF